MDLAGQELDHAVERLGVAARPRHEIEGVAVGQPLQVAQLELEAAVVAPHPAQHADRVALVEPLVDQVHVGPEHSRDATGPVRQLDREEGVAVSGPPAPFALHGERRVDDLSLLQVLDVRASGHRRAVY